MMYPYITLPDNTEITYSHIMERESQREIEVHFERPTDHGFDAARCVLPGYSWIKREGFSEQEINFFEEFLQHNAHVFYKYAEKGGLKIA